jgi:hypothetical protein
VRDGAYSTSRRRLSNSSLRDLVVVAMLCSVSLLATSCAVCARSSSCDPAHAQCVQLASDSISGKGRTQSQLGWTPPARRVHGGLISKP